MTNYPPAYDSSANAQQQAGTIDRQKILDEEHLRLLVVGYYIMGSVVAFYSLFGMLYVAMGLLMFHMPGAFTTVHPAVSGPTPAPTPPGPHMVGDIFAVIGAIFVIGGLVFGALTFLAGLSVARKRHYIFVLVVAGLLCLAVPFGTALGVATFLVLNRRSVLPLVGLPS
jgi:hypothetical protein